MNLGYDPFPCRSTYFNLGPSNGYVMCLPLEKSHAQVVSISDEVDYN
jgi:hypothetical protein